MALIYLTAFWSLGVQIIGLIGSHGVLPIGDFLNYFSHQQGISRFWEFPTLCWINHSDGFLLFLCWAGAALSVLLFFGVMPAVSAFLLWLFYLSLTIAGQEFLGFQWDNLLLEAGFLFIFYSIRPSRTIIWLFRWLLFRLMFDSGLVKVLSGDLNWAHLTALTYHYWTQPLPNIISWYAGQLPLWFQKLSCIVVFIVELFMPFLIFCGSWGRQIAFWAICGLQILIILTGNYCFFNLLTIGLCLTLLINEPVLEKGKIYYKIVEGVVAGLVLIVSLGLMGDSFLRLPLPKPVEKIITVVSPLRSINNYGLFAVMTTERNEIILEGSDDGDKWLPYEFAFKPGDINNAPRWAMPYQPRLDWQMWFAALSPWRDNQWLLYLMERLLQGEPSVERLLAVNPFPHHPPRYIQATLWKYHFTDLKTKGAKGPWWRREILGLYCPTVSLNN